MNKHPKHHSLSFNQNVNRGSAGHLLGIAMVLCITMAAPRAQSQNLWSNTDLVNGGDWDVAGNWSFGTVPVSGNVTQINNEGLAILSNSTGATRELTIGNDTTGNRLNVLNSTLVTRGVILGNGTGSQGSATVGTGTTWSTDGAGTFSAMVVGLSGTGSLIIESGATVASGRTRIAVSAGSTGEATVRGTWTWDSNESIGIGFSTGTGVLNLGVGGLLSLVGSTQIISINSASTLNIGGKVAPEAAGRINAASIANSGTLNFNHTSSDYIFETQTNTSIQITGSGAVNQLSGATTLTANNTYTGNTNITGGTLLINGSLAVSSNVNVASGGTLGGTGVINGNATVSGILSPGNSPGTITFNRDLAFQSLSEIHFDIGLAQDLIQLTGTGQLLSSSADVTFVFNNTGGLQTGIDYELLTWQDATGTNLTNFSASDFRIGNPELSGSFRVSGSSLVVNFAVIPEPSSMLLLLLGTAGWFVARRRH